MPNPVRPTESQFPRVRTSLRPTMGMVVFLLVAAGLTFAGCFAAKYWPYRYREIHPLLEDVFGCQVRIASYHRIYLPHPGFMATGITLTRKSAPDQPPLGTVETLFVQGAWDDLLLLHARVRLVDMTRLHISIPPVGSRAMQQDFPAGSASGFTGPDNAVEVLRIHNSLLEIQRQNKPSLRFAVRELEIGNLKKHQPMHYALQMENAIPDGSIQASGSFGPLNADNVGATNVSGAFTFNRVKLSDVGDLHGTLSSSGRFSGPLNAIEADASEQTPDFAVDDGKATSVSGTIHCIVNGLNGDVMMPDVEVTSGRTKVRAHGQVAGSPKITNLDIAVDSGRAEDVLRPFMHRQVPVLGPVVLHSHAYIGPTGKPVSLTAACGWAVRRAGRKDDAGPTQAARIFHPSASARRAKSNPSKRQMNKKLFPTRFLRSPDPQLLSMESFPARDWCLRFPARRPIYEAPSRLKVRWRISRVISPCRPISPTRLRVSSRSCSSHLLLCLKSTTKAR